jgi:DNA-binding NarL/FixJ family response regulator
VIRVLLADDHELVREGLRAVIDLEEDLTVVAEAGDGVAALEAVARHRPDVAVLDVQMPRLDGIGVCERLASREEGGPGVLVLTTFDDDGYVYRALRAGASGILLKDVPRSQLVQAVRVVAAGDELLAPAITRRLVERFLRTPASVGGLERLTERETEVLRLVGRGLSNREIAALLVLGEATVKTHVGSIFSKLGLRDRAQAVVAAYESGLLRPGG